MIDKEMLEALTLMLDDRDKRFAEMMEDRDKRFAHTMEDRDKQSALMLDDRDKRLTQIMDDRDKRLALMMDAKLEPIMQDLSQLKEDATITRSAVNSLLDWAEEAQVEVKIPLLKKA